VLILLNDEEWGQSSDREIARQTRTSRMLVGQMRKEITVRNDSEKPLRTATMHLRFAFLPDAVCRLCLSPCHRVN